MKRRSFLKKSSLGSLAGFMLNGFPVQTHAGSFFQKLNQLTIDNDRVFVLINLSGGNDGLNTVIPIDQYSQLSNARSNVLIPEAQVLQLNGIAETGLHPAMTRFQQMYNDGKLAIVQNVGYANPNFSHFRATDIWNTASDSNQNMETGWLGRFLLNEYPDYPNGYPTTLMPDPLAITIGAVNSPTCESTNGNTSISIADPNDLYNLLNQISEPAPNNTYGEELTYVRTIMQQANVYLQVVKNAASNATNLSTLYPSNNKLADQLKIVARLIAGGLRTKIYCVNLGGFDTHSIQVDASDHTTGDHATLLKKVSEAVFAFMDDITLHNLQNRVAGMTYSEFGRRIASNGSSGTDHGAAAPLFVFGECVNQSIVGTNPQIPSTVSVSDNVPMQFDFRQVYASVFQDWFQIPSADITQFLPQRTYSTLPIFGCSQALGIEDINAFADIQVLPNPFNDYMQLALSIRQKGKYAIEVFNTLGQLVQNVFDKNIEIGNHFIRLETHKWTAGNYFVTLLHNEKRKTICVTKI